MPKNSRRTEDGVYTRPDRRGFWISYIDAQGRRKQRKLKGAHTLTQARSLRGAELRNIEKARVLGYTLPGKETFGEVVARYLAHQRARLTVAAYERTESIVEAHLMPVFGSVKLADIRRGNVQRYVTERSGEISPATVVREMNVLKHFLNLAVDWKMIPLNPSQRVKPPRVPAGRVRYLQPTELRTVLEACPAWLRTIVALLVTTGMRRSELLGLRWLDVDRASGRILLPRPRTATGVLSILMHLPAKPSIRSPGTARGRQIASSPASTSHPKTSHCGSCALAGRWESRISDCMISDIRVHRGYA